jgi:glycosyltransferase involved in cell wall biosynthesis
VEKPVISILALCYNHEKFLDEALRSIEKLDYPNLEVWLVDDHSKDGSASILKNWQQKRPDWNFVFQYQNQGNCKTFNGLLAKCKGEFVIDFATDDLLISENFEHWITCLQKNSNAGFCYADALVFEEEAEMEYLFSSRVKRKKMPEGNILEFLLEPIFICPPSVLFRKSALDKVGGYDELLAFEDLDIWLRLAKENEVVYCNLPVVKYRKHKNSLSASLFKKRNQKILASTKLILDRISNWEAFKNGSDSYFSFVKYHLKIAGALQFQDEAAYFYSILKRFKNVSFSDQFWKWISVAKVPVFRIFTFYQQNFH